MPFNAGSISFTRYAVVGDAPAMADEALLQKFTDNRLLESDMGLPNDIEYGWCGGRHVFDAVFDFGHNVYNDAVHVGIRIDTNKVPGSIKQAYLAMEEEAAAAGNPSGFISKLQKKDAKDSVRRKVEDEMREGRYRRSSMVPVLWDLTRGELYAPGSTSVRERLYELMERTFDLRLVPLTAGPAALRFLEKSGRRRDYEDAQPARFATGPEGEAQRPDYPWTVKGGEAKDFLGNEFLLWLWFTAEQGAGIVETRTGETAIMFDKTLDMDCAYGTTGRDGFRGEGPTSFPESRDALRTGKVPRKAGLILQAQGQQYTLTLGGESLAVGGLKLPDVEEADNPRVLFEERITLLRDFSGVLDGLFEAYLKARTAGAWQTTVGQMRQWIKTGNRRGGAVSEPASVA